MTHPDTSNITVSINIIEFFKASGSSQSLKQGKKCFEQGKKSGMLSFLQTDRTYLIIQGEIAVKTASGQEITLDQGDLFGEFTPYTINNASAIASADCRLLSLTEKQLLSGLKKTPEFLFFLVDVLFKFLQNPNTHHQDAQLLLESESIKYNCVLDNNTLNELKEKLGEDAFMVVPEKRVVFREGGAALLMYIILDGAMVIFGDGKIVARSTRGNVVGEIALVAPNYSRMASVVAETRCTVLALNRQTFLDFIQKMPTFGLSILRVAVHHFYGRQGMK